MTTIALAGGGTGGHITPLLAVIQEIDNRATCVVIGTQGGREDELLPDDVAIVHRVPRLPFPRRLSLRALAYPFAWTAAVWATRRVLIRESIDVVVGFGGYTAAPSYLAAWLAGIPLVIHEANAIPGLANRLGARLTKRVGVCFPGTPLPHATVVGMPLRREIMELDPGAERKAARSHFGLRLRKPVLLVTGGSSGAKRINDTIDEVAADIVRAGWQVLHLRGPGQDASVPAVADVHRVDYTDRMDLAFAASDVVISRAGAATVSELGVVGLPAVFVPYHVGNGEQQKNAAYAVDRGGALMVETAAFTPQWVRDELIPLLGNREAIAQMAQAMAASAQRGGAEAIAQMALDAVGEV